MWPKIKTGTKGTTKETGIGDHSKQETTGELHKTYTTSNPCKICNLHRVFKAWHQWFQAMFKLQEIIRVHISYKMVFSAYQ